MAATEDSGVKRSDADSRLNPEPPLTAGSTTDDASLGKEKKGHVSVTEADADADAEEMGPLQQILDTRQLIILFTFVWILEFVLAFSSGIYKVMTPYVTSNFKKHALTATTSVIANITSGIIKLPYAKLLDVWGRPQCMATMVVFTTVGAVMLATCQNVEAYCAGQVLCFVGFFGIQFSLVILIADSIAIHQRALLLGFIGTPPVVALWAYGPAAESILNNIGFRWGFGMWAILIPIFSAPVLFLMFKYDGQARRAGLINTPRHNGTPRQVFLHYCKEFDVIGLLLLASGLCLILLAISIYSYQPSGWRSPMIISFIVLGFLLLVAFVFYEKHLAPATFLPWALIKDRTVVFTNLMAAILFLSGSLVSSYVYSMLIVEFKLSVTAATYITSVDMVGSAVSNILVGVAFRWYGHIKHYALCLGIPLFFVGEGLMIGLNIPNPSTVAMIVSQVLLSLGDGVMYPIETLSLMAVSHAHTPALLAVQTTLVACGKGAGSAIATAIWTGMFRQKLAEHLPAENLASLDGIYGSIEIQSSYPTGSAARTAIDRAYGETQRVIFITAISILAIAWISALFLRDFDVRKARTSKKAR
ncbi:siderophore iron transporter [Colletotrichum sojae]|uniref:Siderophore iron transporter n=1 Tax=Colletotrichum sojae TaxID=2175907 RepID=A0A8H6JBS9_9PEZI|nr:siderophore iron transporter [Colletotrichum sojae]